MTKIQRLCAICGVNPATTADHIPPKSIYPAPRDNDANLNVLRTCITCNNGASKEDEEFKIFIGLSTGDYRQNTEALINSMAGTIGKNRRIAHQIFSTKRDVYAQFRSLVVEPAVSIEFDWKKVSQVFDRIVRGLYWMEKGKALGLIPAITVFPFYSVDASFHHSMKELMDCLSPKKLNKDEFTYKVYFCEDGSSIWGMQFFNVSQTTTFAYVNAPQVKLEIDLNL